MGTFDRSTFSSYPILMGDERIDVIAYSGYRGEERPRAFFLHGERIDVIELFGAWVEERSGQRERRRRFLLKGSDGRIHRLSLDEEGMTWFYTG